MLNAGRRGLLKVKGGGFFWRANHEQSQQRCEVKALPRLVVRDGPRLTDLLGEARVVVVGAGVAGLSAAQSLIQAGLKNILVLEASNRPGGRVKSVFIKDSLVEMDTEGEWKGGDWSGLLRESVEEGAIGVPRTGADPSLGLWSRPDGTPLPPLLSSSALRTAQSILRQGHSPDFLAVRIQQELRRFGEKSQEKALRVMMGLMAASEETSMVLNNQEYSTFLKIPDSKIEVPLGLMASLGSTLKQITPSRIRYRKPVQEIRWGLVRGDQRPRAVVISEDRSEFPAEFVILAIPFGFLKERSSKLFCPPLPHQKAAAIESLSYTPFNKLYIEVSMPLYAWERSCGEIKLREPKGNRSWTRGISSLHLVPGSQYLFTITISGPSALEMEQLKPQEIEKELTEWMKGELGCEVPGPIKIHTRRWSKENYFRGRQDPKVPLNESELSCVRLLEEPLPRPGGPLPSVLFFAGDFASSTMHSSIHEATLTGIRQAQRVLEEIERFAHDVPKAAICHYN